MAKASKNSLARFVKFLPREETPTLKSIAERLEKKLRVPSLANDFMVERPNYFRVLSFDKK